MSLLSDLINLDLSETTEKVNAEYIWIGGSGMDLRSKGKTLPGPVSDPSKLPKWSYDGSSTGQAPGDDSEVILYPQAIFRDPFRRGKNILVICDAYTPAGEPIPTNKRHSAAKIFSHPDVIAGEPWYGIEQEYTLLQKDVNWPPGWPVGGFPGPQGPYYCGAGADKAFGGDIVDAHYKACLYAGINISGINGEVMPGQWEFQAGPGVGVSAGDELLCARYIAHINGLFLKTNSLELIDWNSQNQGSDGKAVIRMKFSALGMRNARGYEAAKLAVHKLKMMDDLLGDGNRDYKIIPYYDAPIQGDAKPSGYVVDVKMPQSLEMTDPYIVTSSIANTVLLWKPTISEILTAKSQNNSFLRVVRNGKWSCA